MRRAKFVAPLALCACLLTLAADWPAQSGGPQRDGWAKSEGLLSSKNIGSLQLLYKFKADNATRGLDSLTPPIVNGNLITYRGFKEMLIFGGSSEKVFSVDADLNKLIWESSFAKGEERSPDKAPTVTCPGGLTAPVTMAGSSSASMQFAALAARMPAVGGLRPRRPSPYFPPLAQSIYPLTPTTLTQLAAMYALSGSGYLHVVNSSTGEDLLPAIKFLPPNQRVTSLNVWQNVIYATTAGDCNGNANSLYAIDLLSKDHKVASFATEGGGFAGLGGTAVGHDGTVYVQVTNRPGDRPGQYRDTVVALTPRDLKVKDYFTPKGKSLNKKDLSEPGITPLVFRQQGRDMILAGGRDGRLYLLQASSLGGADHATPLLKTDVIAPRAKNYDGAGFRGTFSSWQDVDTGLRWFYAPVFGRAKTPKGVENGAAAPKNGSVVAYKLSEQNGQPSLQFLWISGDVPSPSPVVIANGLALLLSSGDSPRIAKKNGEPYTVAERQQSGQHATVYALDALTGKQLYSSGSQVTGYSHPAALAVANGRLYFATSENSMYCFGFPATQPQLAAQ